VLDVGAGTGRASLPLAKAGYSVIAVDSSDAMLECYRQEVGTTPVQFRVMDAAQLDCADATFDSVIALNTMVHFPHWRAVLAEWTRAVRPGGRVIFDLCSQDHLDTARAVCGLPPPSEVAHPADFFACASGAEMAAVADELGLSIVALIPYGLFSSGLDYNLWRPGSLAVGSGWERLVSWIAVDPQLLAFSEFIERELVGALSIRVTGRFMAILEKRPGANDDWLAQQECLNATLADAERLRQALPPSWDASWCERLNRHLDHARNRVLFYFLWTCLWAYPSLPDPALWLEPQHSRTLRAWRRARELDTATTEALRAFIQEPAFAALFDQSGVNLRAGLEYELTRELLTDYHQAFAQC